MRALPTTALAVLVVLLAAGCLGAGGTAATPSRQPRKVTVPLAPMNAAEVSGTAVLTRAKASSQKTRVNVALASRPAQDVTVEIDVGRCSKPVSLKPQTVLGKMPGTFASWRVPGRLAAFLAAPAALVVRTPQTSRGGPVGACGPIRAR